MEGWPRTGWPRAGTPPTAEILDATATSLWSTGGGGEWGWGVGGRGDCSENNEKQPSTLSTAPHTEGREKTERKNWVASPPSLGTQEPPPPSSPTRQAYWKGKRAECQSGMLAGHRLPGAGQSGETIARAARESEGGWGANRGLFGVTGMVILISGVKRFHVLRLDLWRCPRADSVPPPVLVFPFSNSPRLVNIKNAPVT